MVYSSTHRTLPGPGLELQEIGREKDFGKKQDTLFEKRFSSETKAGLLTLGFAKWVLSYRINMASLLSGPS